MTSHVFPQWAGNTRRLLQPNDNVLETRAHGDIAARARKKGVNKQQKLETAQNSRLSTPLLAAQDLWRATDHLVGEGGVPLYRFEHASPYMSLVGGRGLSFAYAGQTTSFTLVSRNHVGQPLDHGGSAWNATISGPGRADCSLIDHGDGVYTISYVGSTSGRYRLSVRLGEQHLSGSPFGILVRTVPPWMLAAEENAAAHPLSIYVHTLRGLFHRWLAYLPLHQLMEQRRATLNGIADDHRRHIWGCIVFDALGADAVRRKARNELHHSSIFVVIKRRAINGLALWRKRAYLRMGWQLTFAMARRALIPLEKGAAIKVWLRRIMEGDLEKERRREAMEKAARNLLHAETARGWNAWRELILERAAMAHAAKRIIYQDVARALRMWESVVEERNRQMAALRKAALGILKQQLARGWRQLHAIVTAEREALRRMRNFVARLTNQNVAKAMSAWAEAAAELADSMNALRRGLATLRNRDLAAAWRSWAEKAAALAHNMNAMQRAAAAIVHRGKAAVWNTWAQFATEHAEAMNALTKAAGRLVYRSRALAWQSWAEFASSRIESLEKLRNGVGHIMHRQLSAGFRQWRGNALHMQAMQRGAAALLQETGRALRSWSAMATARRDALERLCVGVARWCRGELVAAVSRWHENAEQQMRLREVGLKLKGQEIGKAWRKWAEVASGRAAAMSAMRKVAGTLRNKGLSAAWRSWIESSSSRAAALQGLRKAVARLINKQISGALNRWHEFQEERRNARKAMSSFVNHGMAMAFRTWAEHAESTKTSLAKLRKGVGHIMHRQLSAGLLQWKRNAQWAAAMQKGAKILFQDKARALRSWYEMAMDSKEAMGKLKAAAASMRSIGQRKVWNTWSEMALAAAEALRKLKSAAASMRSIGLRKSWNAWSENALERAAAMGALQKAAASLIHKGKSAVWRTWAEAASARSAAMEVLEVAASRMFHRQKGGAFRRWLDFQEERRKARKAASSFLNQSKAAAFRTWVEVAYLRGEAMDKLAAAGGALFHRQLLGAWRSWCEQNAKAHKNKSFFLRWMNSSLAAAVSKWQEAVNDQVEAMRKLRAAAATILNKALSAGWHSWREQYAEALAKNQTKDAARRVVRQLFQQALARGWRQLVDVTTAELEALRRMRQVTSRLMMQNQAKAMTAWAEMAAERAESMNALRKAASSLRNRGLAAAWNTWFSNADERAAALQSLRVAANNILNKALGNGLRRWIEFHEERRIARKAMGGFVHRGKAMAFRSWYEAAADTAAAMASLKRSIGHIMHRQLSAGLLQWKRNAKWNNAMQRSARLLFDKKAQMFVCWQMMAAARMDALSTMRRAVKKIIYRARSQAWNTWVDYLEQRALSMHKLKNCVLKMRHRGLSRGLAGWILYSDAVTAEKMRKRLEAKQKQVEAELEDAPGGIARMEALMQQNAQLRAAAASMSDYVDRIAAQVSAVLAPHAPQHAAYGWYVHYMEERIEEMRKQVERANQVVDGAESMLHLGDELGKEEDLPTGGVREANAAKAAAAEMAGLPAVAQGTRRYSIYGGGAPDAAPPHPSQERPLRRSVSFGTQGRAGCVPALHSSASQPLLPTTHSHPSTHVPSTPAPGTRPSSAGTAGTGPTSNHQLNQVANLAAFGLGTLYGLVDAELDAAALAAEWDGHRPLFATRKSPPQPAPAPRRSTSPTPRISPIRSPQRGADSIHSPPREAVREAAAKELADRIARRMSPPSPKAYPTPEVTPEVSQVVRRVEAKWQRTRAYGSVYSPARRASTPPPRGRSPARQMRAPSPMPWRPAGPGGAWVPPREGW